MYPAEKLDMFRNRLTKNNRHLKKWAQRAGVTCYRLYDADIPEFPLIVETYTSFVHVSVYDRQHPLDEASYAMWKAGSLQTISEVLDIPQDRIFLKNRSRQKGSSQYIRQETSGQEILVSEGGLSFLVNPSDYLDTGLFLDHRLTRAMIRERAAGKSVLNLFCYTGSFTVYAAAGGAKETLSLDLSATYLRWAERNLACNGLAGPTHRFLQTDILDWLKQPIRETFDLVVLDPPTFSNSKRMTGVLDIQRDHVFLVNQVLERVRPGGEIFFSTNHRSFRLDAGSVHSPEIRDITRLTLPEDFRNSRIHQCFLIRKPEQEVIRS